MKTTIFKISLVTLLMVACSHPHPKGKEDREYKGVNFSKLYQKDRSYDALNNDLTAICDRILNFSSKNWVLNENENKMIEGYIRQNKIFEQKDFDKDWLDRSKIMFDRIFNDEQNLIAPAIYQKFEDLYSEVHPATAPAIKNN